MLQKALHAHQSGDLAAAERGYRAVLARDRTNRDALYLLGLLLHQTARHAEAVAPLQRCVRQPNPRAEFLNTLGDVHRVLGALGTARECLEQALILRPDYVDAQVNLATTLHAEGRLTDALSLLFEAVAVSPGSAPLRHLAGSLLDGVVLHTASSNARRVLQLLCTDDQIGSQSLAGSVLGLLASEASFLVVQRVVHANLDPFAHAPDAVASLARDPLLCAALPRIMICDGDIERVFTAIRRGVGQRLMSTLPDETGTRDAFAELQGFAGVLAAQCHLTEYAWVVREEEAEAVAQWKTHLEHQLQHENLEPEFLAAPLLRFALYEPLHGVAGWRRLLDVPESAWPPALGVLIAEQLIAHAEEMAIAAALPMITPIVDDVSAEVRAMYESNPYPRWSTMRAPRTTTIADFIRELRPERPTAPYTTDILVAGCGSGQQPVHVARSFRESNVVAFDLSRTSLAYASRMAVRHDAARIRFAQGDLLEIPPTFGPFAIVSCSGVLHHLRDPMAGWRRLMAVLAPGGVMKIGLYSTKARESVEAAREFGRTSGFRADANGIRACRQAILELPDQHPARGVLAFADFFSLSGCRDLIMHVQERTYTIPDIAAALETLGLQFLGFQLTHVVRSQFVVERGSDALRDLAAWDRFEAEHPSTFAAMYQFWCGAADDGAVATSPSATATPATPS